MIENEEYFNNIYDNSYDKILSYVISKTDNISNVTDIMQNIYLNLFNTINKKGRDYVDNYEKFLFKIAKVEIYKYYKLKTKIKILFIDDSNIMDSEIVDLSNENELEKSVFDKLDAEKIWEAIKEEKLVIQKIMTLYFLQDKKIKEISELLELKESTVKTNLYRTISKLRERFGEKNE